MSTLCIGFANSIYSFSAIQVVVYYSYQKIYFSKNTAGKLDHNFLTRINAVASCSIEKCVEGYTPSSHVFSSSLYFAYKQVQYLKILPFSFVVANLINNQAVLFQARERPKSKLQRSTKRKKRSQMNFGRS